MKQLSGKMLSTLLAIVILSLPLFSQDIQISPPVKPPQGDASKNTPDAPEHWNLYYQATSIASTHGPFPALYSGAFSLQNRREAEVSLTTTLFFGLRLARYTELYVNPEIAGGRGFSGVNGLANQYNG